MTQKVSVGICHSKQIIFVTYGLGFANTVIETSAGCRCKKISTYVVNKPMIANYATVGDNPTSCGYGGVVICPLSSPVVQSI